MKNIKKSRTLIVIGLVVIALFVVMTVNRAGLLTGNSLAAETTNIGTISSITGNTQEIETQLPQNGYPIITVQKGIPVKWNLIADSATINSCNGTLVIPEYNVKVDLKPGDNIIEFTPDQSGIIPYSCWMGMINSQINVVDSIDQANAADLSGLSVIGGEQGSSGSGCCGIAKTKGE